MNKEPALLFAVLAAVGALLVSYGLVAEDKLELWQTLVLALLPLLQGYFTRSQVVPVSTVNEAGLTTDELKEYAADPNIQPKSE